MPTLPENPKPAPRIPTTIAAALRKWIDANETGLNGFVGVGMLPIRINFNMAANDGAGDVKVQLGM